MTLLDRTRAAIARARTDGTLRPLPSVVRPVRDPAGVTFQVREIVRFEQKPLGTRETDPFQPPWTDALFVGDWGPDHALLLNKFPVLDDHLLLVTRAWADQEAPLDAGDVAALNRALLEMDGLWFYNGGRAAGASQPHRHLQLVAREALGEIPLEAMVREAVGAGRRTVAAFPFRHTLLADNSPEAIGEALGPNPGPHTLIGARGWTLVVPRRTASVAGMPVNSLAYAGFLAVKTRDGLAWIAEHGGFAVLREAAFPA